MWQVNQSPRLYSPGGRIGLTVWLQFEIACFGWGFNPQISASGKGQRHSVNVSSDPTSVAAKWHLNPSNGLSSGLECCDRRQTDRRYGEMCRNRRNRVHCKTDSEFRFRLKQIRHARQWDWCLKCEEQTFSRSSFPPLPVLYLLPFLHTPS